MVIYLLTYCYAIISFFLLGGAISYSKKSYSPKRLLGIWYGTGLIFNLISFSWYYSVYPLIWLPPGILQIIGIAIAHIILSVVAGLPYVICALIFTRDARHVSPWLQPIIFGATLSFAEIFRSLFISTLFKGGGTDISFHYISGAFGNALSMTPLVEFAYIGGTYMLSFLFGVLVYMVMTWRSYKMYLPHLGVFLVAFYFLHTMQTFGPEDTTKIGIVTTAFPDISDDNLVQASFTKRAPALLLATKGFSTSTDVIVYPEDTRLTTSLPQKEISSLHREFPDTLLVDGNTLRVNGKLTNVSVFSSPIATTTALRSKSFLLPYNEYMPYFFSYLLPLFLPKSELSSYENNHTYIPIESGNVYQFKDLRVATLLCSEIISYKVLENIKKENPSIVFFQSRLEVFHDNPLFWMHLYMFSKTAAAELRRPLVSSADGAPSLVVSPHGSIVKIIPTGYATTSITYPF